MLRGRFTLLDFGCGETEEETACRLVSVGEWPGLVADRQQNYSYFSDQISDKKVIPSAAEDYFKFTRNSFNSVYVKLDKKFSQLFGHEFRKISRNPYLS